MRFTNNKSGEVVNSDLSLSEIAAEFAGIANEACWIWFWMVKAIQNKPSVAHQNMIAFLADSFLYALGMGLKRPMIRLHSADYRYKIYLSKRGTLCFKTGALIPGTSNPSGNEEYFGCLWDGKFLPMKGRTVRTHEKEFLDRMSADPVAFMATCSKDMNRCCYCNQPLEDQRSKDVGYGPVCAEHWGLAWGRDKYDEKVPSFAQLWSQATVSETHNVRLMCAAVRATPSDDALWLILGDALEEAGLPVRANPKKPWQRPQSGVTIPAG